MNFRARKPTNHDIAEDVRVTGGIIDVQPEGGVYETTVYLLAGQTIEYGMLGLPVPQIDAQGKTGYYRYPPLPEGGQPGIAFQWLEMEGPIAPASWPPASHRVLFDDLGADVKSAKPAEDAKRLLRRFIALAAREPVPEEAIPPFEKLVLDALQNGAPLAEALLATRIEKLYSKDKILELYLNVVYWGNQAYGAEKAAKRYFNKPAEELSLAQAALMAGLLKAPEGLNPYVFPNAAKARQILVLNAMENHGFITAEQHSQALEESLRYDRVKTQYRHPFFVNHVRQEMIEAFGEDVVRRGGLIVTTTLDQRVQSAAEASMKVAFQKAPPSSNLKEGAMIVLNVDEDQILGMVGGKDFNHSQFNNATMARRSPGSTFKPFVYLTGFRLGKITPDSTIYDKPISFNTGYGFWKPKNYDGVFKGRMQIRQALAQSRNTTTVQVGQRVGLNAIIETARLAGIQSDIAPNFASLLGASGVSVLELANAYSTFARGGIYRTPQAILRIQEPTGKEIFRKVEAPKRHLDERPVAMINSALKSVVDFGTGNKARLKNRDVAGKTGTTDQTRDIWFSGYTRDFVATIWLGHPQNLPLKGVGSGYCVDVWKRFADDYYSFTLTSPRPLMTKY
jgi:membrane peptidoglycan carboxypeptidase